MMIYNKIDTFIKSIDNSNFNNYLTIRKHQESITEHTKNNIKTINTFVTHSLINSCSKHTVFFILMMCIQKYMKIIVDFEYTKE
ncbi:hypothetical protein ENUP19_0071G0044 [Entamoeba nuttalli]|uniref:Uncharacterized protein n=1 Tax=Entamoeba nuttalli TaxID=412467 RepID=A0ABQ0DEE6_9EUKA